jgi:hypothetical protein
VLVTFEGFASPKAFDCEMPWSKCRIEYIQYLAQGDILIRNLEGEVQVVFKINHNLGYFRSTVHRYSPSIASLISRLQIETTRIRRDLPSGKLWISSLSINSYSLVRPTPSIAQASFTLTVRRKSELGSRIWTGR